MDLENELDPKTWQAVRAVYEAQNYSAAIVAAVQQLTEVLRNKSGCDGDGQSLVGQAWGGEDPIIKLNALRTESDRNEQRGFEMLLRGVYTGLRNPRTHETKQDASETADTVILFIDWIVQRLNSSRSPFEPTNVLQRVWDEHFVPMKRYASLLVEETPPRIRLDVLIHLLDEAKIGKLRAAKVFTSTMLPFLTDIEQEVFWREISERLRSATSDLDFVTMVRLGSIDWSRCSEAARMRAENRLLRSIREGKGTSGNLGDQKGWLGLWSKDIYSSFMMESDLVAALNAKLRSFDDEESAYVTAHFMKELLKLQPEPPEALVDLLISRLKSKDSSMYFALQFLDDPDAPRAWAEVIKPTRDAFEFDDIHF